MNKDAGQEIDPLLAFDAQRGRGMPSGRDGFVVKQLIKVRAAQVSRFGLK
jgi:hypothetical protein